MGPYKATQEDLEIRMWCYRNRVVITPVEVGYRKRSWYIEIDVGGKINKSPECYTHTQIWNQIFKYRKYYYEKYKQ